MKQDQESNINSFVKLESSIKETQDANQYEQPSKEDIRLPKLTWKKKRIIDTDLGTHHIHTEIAEAGTGHWLQEISLITANIQEMIGYLDWCLEYMDWVREKMKLRVSPLDEKLETGQHAQEQYPCIARLESSIKETQDANQYEQPSKEDIRLPKLVSHVIKEYIMVEHKEVQSKVKEKLEFSLKEHKEKYHVKKRFHVGDLVMVDFRNKFSVAKFNKMKMKRIGSCKVLQMLDKNNYVIVLPKHLPISPLFDADDLFEFKRAT
ncbi:hypothetical protein Tco_0893196 [Tanacetum coccineum]|uniref:Tf2-1-like SH3-like domain-containing protein n=1 Tax=Tanacetum coccineum TaxID=301880 RepID=A0ABQ5CEB3_9ASTR